MKSKPKKILFLVSFPFPWMSVPLLYNVLPKLAKRDSIYVTNRGEEAKKWKGVNFINFGNMDQISFNIKLRSWLNKNLQNYDEVFIYNDYNLVLSTYGPLKKHNRRVNYIFESKWFIKIKDILSPLFIRRLNSKYYKNILILDELLIDYLQKKGLKNKNLRVISTGVNRTYFTPSPVPRNHQIVYVGNLGKRRRLSVMIDSFSKVAEQVKDAKLIVVGDGNDRLNLIEQSKKLGLADKIVFTGFIEHSKVGSFIKSSAVCFAAYPKDKFDIQLPYKTLEYMASNRPVVTTNTTAIKYYFRDGHEVLMCEYKPEAIAEKIILILKNRTLLERVAKKGYLKSQGFSWEKIQSIFEEVINE